MMLLVQAAPGGPSPAEVQKRLEEAVRVAPKDPRGWILLAQARAAQGDKEGALQAAARASETAGKDSTVLFNLAVLYQRLDNAELAIGAGLRAREIEKSPELELLLAESYDRSGDWEKAKAGYAEARRLDPYSEGPIFRAAQAYLRHMDFAGAAQVLEDGRKTFDKSPQLELALGVAYYGQRKFTEALGQFLRVINLDPGIPQAYAFSGKLLEHAGDRLAECKAKFAAYERVNPKDSMGFVLHAKALLEEDESGNLAEAKTLLAKGLAVKDDDAEGHFLMGRVLESERDLAGAANEYERSAALNPKEPGTHFRLARVYERLGRKEDAARERRLHEELDRGGAK
jgi:tetratricopeptide (TPR) repeat protein